MSRHIKTPEQQLISNAMVRGIIEIFINPEIGHDWVESLMRDTLASTVEDKDGKPIVIDDDMIDETYEGIGERLKSMIPGLVWELDVAHQDNYKEYLP